MMYRVVKAGMASGLHEVKEFWDFEELLDCISWLDFQADLEKEAYDKIDNK